MSYKVGRQGRRGRGAAGRHNPLSLAGLDIQFGLNRVHLARTRLPDCRNLAQLVRESEPGALLHRA